MLSLDCSCPRAESAKAKISRISQRTTRSDFPKTIAARLESQSRLITHRHAVEHVTRRGGFPMSREIGIKDWARLGHHHPGNLRSQIPVALPGGNSGLDLRDARRLRRLINLEGKDRRANQNGSGRDRVGCEPGDIEAQHKILCPLHGDFPQWLPKQFVALTAMEFVQEVFEITRRRLFESLQAQQPANFVIVKF